MNHPDLFALLRGELTNTEATAAGDHLDSCVDCRSELAELAVGNSLLVRAARTVAEPGGTATPPDLPPFVAPGPRRARRVPALLVAVAAGIALIAGVAFGALGGSLLDQSGDDPAPATAYASVPLSTVEGSTVRDDTDGEVRMVATDRRHTEMTIEAPALPGAGRGHFYYAWLLDPETNKMLPLGQVGPGGSASFELADSLLDSYSAVDVSLEDDDGDPGHSVTSVLRGSYADDTSTAS